MKEVVMYECDYCKKKVLRTKSGIKQHEKKCFWNTESKSCMTCQNFITGGHYLSHCKHKHMNKSEKYTDGEYHQQIQKLQHNCILYIYDELTFEERQQILDDNNSDARADHEEYERNRM